MDSEDRNQRCRKEIVGKGESCKWSLVGSYHHHWFLGRYPKVSPLGAMPEEVGTAATQLAGQIFDLTSFFATHLRSHFLVKGYSLSRICLRTPPPKKKIQKAWQSSKQQSWALSTGLFSGKQPRKIWRSTYFIHQQHLWCSLGSIRKALNQLVLVEWQEKMT